MLEGTWDFRKEGTKRREEIGRRKEIKASGSDQSINRSIVYNQIRKKGEWKGKGEKIKRLQRGKRDSRLWTRNKSNWPSKGKKGKKNKLKKGKLRF